MVRAECMATVGAVSNPDNGNIKLGKAGRNRWLGKRPSVRGVAMNPIDHPMAAARAAASGGRHPVTPWGKPTKGKRTRSNKSQPTNTSCAASPAQEATVRGRYQWHVQCGKARSSTAIC